MPTLTDDRLLALVRADLQSQPGRREALSATGAAICMCVAVAAVGLLLVGLVPV